MTEILTALSAQYGQTLDEIRGAAYSLIQWTESQSPECVSDFNMARARKALFSLNRATTYIGIDDNKVEVMM